MKEYLSAEAWKGPFAHDTTSEDIFQEYFEYSDEGLKAANEWLEQKQRELC